MYFYFNIFNDSIFIEQKFIHLFIKIKQNRTNFVKAIVLKVLTFIVSIPFVPCWWAFYSVCGVRGPLCHLIYL